LTPAQWQRVNALFDAAVELPAGGQRAYVERESAGDREVRDEVLGLLKAHAASGSFLDSPIAHLSPQSRLSRLSEQLQAARTFKAGEVVGDFEIQRLIGEGAFARVYLARQRSLGRQVALKVTANIGREARTMAGLEHDYIVPVFSETVDAANDLRIICMQLVAGATLQQVIDHLGRLRPEERSGAAVLGIIDAADASGTLFNAAAVKDRESLSRMDYPTACLWLGARLADALAFAHARGILHLDVKPANILLNRYGRPLLTDFNVAITPEDLVSRNPTRVGGTLAYMSPFRPASSRARPGSTGAPTSIPSGSC
jgi:serine/threonine protein kinase